MDIRDIKGDIEYPKNSLEMIFNLQKVLVDKYIEIEGLPQYPINVNTKESQKLIKDFSSRVIEELGEGFESYLLMLDLFHNGINKQEMIPHLQNFNEEVADTLHFWVELLIYLGFDVQSINGWLKLWDKCNGHSDILQSWLTLADWELNMELKFKKLPCSMVIKDDEDILKDEFLRGGRSLSTERMDIMKRLLWDITFYFQMARNTLKNKPWKQTQMLTDWNQFELAIAQATMALFKFLSFSGFTKESLYTIYYKKNKVNQFRIESKY